MKKKTVKKIKEKLIGEVVFDSFDRYTDVLFDELELSDSKERVMVKTENINQSGSGAELRCTFYTKNGLVLTDEQVEKILYVLEPDFAQEYGRFKVKEIFK